MIRKTLPVLLFLAAAATVPGGSTSPAIPFHFSLKTSAPEADTQVEAPEEVKLWFTQVPQEGTTSIRVLDAGGELVPTSEVAQDAEDGTLFTVAFEDTPTPGPYTVAWRALGQDGHVVRGDYSFTVVAQ